MVSGETAMKWRRTIGWFIISVAVSLVPLVAAWITLIEKQKPDGFSDVLSKGDLILIGVVLNAGSVWDMIVRKTKTTRGFSTPEAIIIALAIVVLVFGSMLYGLVSFGGDAQLAVLISLGTFVAAVAIGLSSIWLTTD